MNHVSAEFWLFVHSFFIANGPRHETAKRDEHVDRGGKNEISISANLFAFFIVPQESCERFSSVCFGDDRPGEEKRVESLIGVIQFT